MGLSALLISNGFQPNYEKAFANGLAANAVAVTLITSERSLVNDLAPSVRTLGIRGSQDSKRTRWQKGTNLLRYARDLVTHIRENSYDVVHLTGMFMTRNVLAGVFEWMLYRLICQRFVMTVHNILPHGRHGLWYRLNYHLVYRLAHLLVVHTEKMKSELVNGFGIRPDRIVVMAHGVDEVPKTLTVPPASSHLRVLLFGGLNHYKGVDQFLRAAAICKDVPMRIVIAGETRDAEYAALINQLVAAVPAVHEVEWHRGFIQEERVKDYFEAAEVVVLPYRHIDQSGVLFTAFRFGTPLIATDVGSFREGIPEFAGLLARSAEPEDLASTIREFSASSGAFNREQIRAHAKSLSWPNCVRPLVAAYQRLCH